MTTEPTTYGLLLRIESSRYGMGPRLVAEIVKREGDHHAPRNVSDYAPWDDAPYISGLAMSGWVSDYDPHPFIGFEPAFFAHRIDERTANRMAKTLHKINARINKDAAMDAPDMLMALAHATKLTFVVERADDGSGRYASSYDDNQWRWMTVAEGRNRYRALIEKLRNEEIARKAA